MRPRICQLLVTIAVGVASLAGARACQVPVFRYALERWPADRYELAVFHRGGLNSEHRSALASVTPLANIEVVEVDVAKMGVAEQAIYGPVELDAGDASMRLYYPRDSGIEEPVWTADLSRGAVAKLVDSPARREIRARLLSGKSAVWVIVGGAGDAALEERVRGQLAGISKTLEIPEGVVGPGSLDRVASGEVAMEDVLRSAIPLKIEFDVMQIDRDDPAEAPFVAMLFGVSAGALEQYPDSPLLFPVFGRGRTIDGLPAPMVSEGLLEGACAYLCGACSCEVKKENPGIDLVMSADWDAAIAGSEVVVEKALPPLSGAGDVVGSVTVISESPSALAERMANKLLWQAGLMASGFIALVVIVTLALRKGAKE